MKGSPVRSQGIDACARPADVCRPIDSTGPALAGGSVGVGGADDVGGEPCSPTRLRGQSSPTITTQRWARCRLTDVRHVANRFDSRAAATPRTTASAILLTPPPFWLTLTLFLLFFCGERLNDRVGGGRSPPRA